MGAVVANQISFTLVSILANSKGGNLSAFMYAYTFMQLPYAIIAVSIAYAVAPDLAELWNSGDREGFASRVSYAMRITVVLILPGGVGYALLARPAILLVLAHGHLSASSAALTGSLLAIFALGLPGFSAYLLLMRAFQSKQDTRSMFWLYVAENALTVVAALALYPLWGVRGLAAAWIGAYTLVLPVAWHGCTKVPTSYCYLAGFSEPSWPRALWPPSWPGSCRSSPGDIRLKLLRRGSCSLSWQAPGYSSWRHRRWE